MVTWSTESPRSAIISSRSRYVSEYRRYQRTHKRMISSSKCRPRKSAGLFRVTIHRTKSPQPRLQQNPPSYYTQVMFASCLGDHTLTSSVSGAGDKFFYSEIGSSSKVCLKLVNRSEE